MKRKALMTMAFTAALWIMSAVAAWAAYAPKKY